MSASLTPDRALMPEVEDALLTAVQQAAARRPVWRARTATRRGLAITLATLLVGGSALAAVEQWHPELGGIIGGHPSVTTSPVPASELALLGVLRRPQTNADRSPAVLAILRKLAAANVAGVHVDAIRLLIHTPAMTVVLVPVRREGALGPVRYAPGVSPGGSLSTVVNNVICVLLQTHGPSVFETCDNTAQIEAGELLMNNGNGRRTSFIVGVVPDGVSRVSVTIRDGLTLSAETLRNAFHLVVPGAGLGDLPTKIAWYDATGRETGLCNYGQAQAQSCESASALAAP